MKMRMVDYLINRIYDAGAESVFFVPGNGCMFLTDALAKKKELNAVSVHHEQAAGMAALTYAKCNEKLGACVVTTGCGGTNAVTALLHAWQDNVPCVFISGQAARHQTVRNAEVPLRQMGRQEADIVSIVDSITKYAVMINSVDDAVYEIDKALYYVSEGRKGPVWIDVPMDIQSSLIDTDTYKRFERPVNVFSTEFSDENKKAIIDALSQAERPVMLIGNGIRLAGAIPQLYEFAEKYQIPITYSRLGHDLFETDNPLSIGMVGMAGATRAGNFALANSDLVLCIGCRLSIDTTGYEYEKFAREAKLIVIDIDETEHMKNTVKIDTFIQADAKVFLSAMNEEEPSKQYPDWKRKCLHWKEIFPVQIGESVVDERINMYRFTDALSNAVPKNATIISDAGYVFYTVTSAVRVTKGQRSITSGGQAEMGYTLPATIGAAFANGGPVYGVTGDGSIMMNLQELQTLSHHKLPIVVFVMNNNGYCCIRRHQNALFRGRMIGCDSDTGISFPSFEKIANAFDIKYRKIDAEGVLEDKIKEVINEDGPIICEVMCDVEQNFLAVATAMNSKKRMVNRPLEDQSPFLDREIFENEMVIQPLD